MLKYLTTCAQLLAEIGLERIQGTAHEADLLRWAQELNGANQALRQQREAALSLAEDANEARATAERVQEALLLKDSAVDSAASGIVFVALDNKLTFANPSALRMWGYARGERDPGQALDGTFVKSASEATDGVSVRLWRRGSGTEIWRPAEATARTSSPRSRPASSGTGTASRSA